MINTRVDKLGFVMENVALGYFFRYLSFFPSHGHSTYLLTPWCRVLLEKLTGFQLVKKFPAFHGTRSFITALTSVRHQSLSWASPIQSIYPHPTSWRSILMLSTHLRLGLPISILLATHIHSYIPLQMDNGLVSGHKLTHHETEKIFYQF